MDFNINTILSKMTLEEKIGQMISVGVLEDDCGLPSKNMKKVMETIKPGGIRIYGNSFLNNTLYFKAAQYINQIKKWNYENDSLFLPLIAADCENGLGSIVNYGVNFFPFLMGRTAIDSVEMAGKISAALAQEGKAVGLNVIQQPVVDVNTNPRNPIIGVRSAGDTPEQVIKYTLAQMKAQQREGVIAVAKHYPGHGDTAIDSHKELPEIELEEDKFRELHLKPFQKIIEAGVDAIMTSHIIFNCIDEKNPATLSCAVLTELLRKEQGFEGVVITDGMTMKAITDNYGTGEAAVKSVQAGCDIVLASGDYDFQMRTYESLIKAAEKNKITKNRIDESVSRIITLKKKYELTREKQPDLEPVEPGALFKIVENNYEISKQAFQKSYTIMGDEKNIFLDKNDTIFICGSTEVNRVAECLDKEFNNVISFQYHREEKKIKFSRNYIDKIVNLSENANKVMILTFNKGELPAGEIKLIEELNQEKEVVVISLGLPYEFLRLPDDIGFIATYLKNRRGNPSPLPEAALEALIQILTGKSQAGGKLPLKDSFAKM
ncbi:MAG: glycoside hydrolase family 3 protein [Halanaerobiaceae bacterium]